jgi:hypothetical protein
MSKDELKKAFDAGYDYRTSLDDYIYNEYGPGSAPDFETWYAEQNLNKHGVSNKRQIQWRAIESYIFRFSTNQEKFRLIMLNQARDWFEREFAACAGPEGGAAPQSAEGESGIAQT